MGNNTSTITFAIMDPPYERARVITSLRLIEAALRKGINVNVFAYEGAVSLGFTEQKPHANPVKGTSEEEEAHPLPKDWIAALGELGNGQDGHGKLDWVNCGLCVDERGMQNQATGRRGGPPDFFEFIENSSNVLTIGTR
ncbi:MAG: DsrE family protein [SAR324 cluster bacterium]|nr:DsrE family protein [SAR324 cluster bacterium]